MPAAATAGVKNRIPPELRAVPIHPVDETHPLRLCVLARSVPDPVGGHFVQLRQSPDARVYLGGLCDAQERVLEWLEIWVQNLEGLATSPAAHRKVLANAFQDQRWARQCEAFQRWAPEDFIATGWETQHPPPTVFDATAFAMKPPRPPAGGGRWELCLHEKSLEDAGLPAYGSSLARYLYNGESGNPRQFVAVAGTKSESPATLPQEEALGLGENMVPFNLHGGLMLVSRLHPLSLEEFAGVLAGKPWPGLTLGRTALHLSRVYEGLSEANFFGNQAGWLFLGAHGRSGRMVEALHLKLRLLADAFRAARAGVAAHQLPFLNLSPGAFRVKLAEVSTGLPHLWTARCDLFAPPQTVALQIKTTEKRLFVRAGDLAPSIYLPEGQASGNQGLGSVRVRKAQPPRQDQQEFLIIEGTLVLQEPRRCSPRDILWVQLPLGNELVDLYGHIDSDSLAIREVRFRTLPQQFPPAAATALRSGTLVVFPPSPYQIIPLLSSPCDLYALGVIAIRTLLVNDPASLPAALDDLLSLARQAALDHQPGAPLPTRIAAIFAQKAQWLESLGPHRLLAEELSPAQGSALVPAELWHEVLAFLVRLFPGAGPDSYRADLGDAPPLALETVFDQPLADLENLVTKTRSLVVIDWNFNREIRAVIDELRER